MHGAAARLNLTQPAVSRLVQRLEADLGAVLFDRSSKPPTLTPAGRQALAHGQRVVQAIDDLSGSVADESGPSGSFRLGVSVGLSQLVLNDPIDALHHDCPMMSVRIVSDWSKNLTREVESNNLDAAVLVTHDGDEPATALPAAKIGSDRLMIVAGKKLDLPQRVKIAELAHYGWVVHPEGCSYRAALRRALAQAKVPFNVAVEAFDQELQLSLVARGNGIGLMPAVLLEHSAFRDQLHSIQVDELDYRMAVWIVRGRFIGSLSTVVDALESALRQTLAQSNHAEIAFT